MTRLLSLLLVLGCAPKQPATPPAAAPSHDPEPHGELGHGTHHGAHAGHDDGATTHHRFDDVERWTAVFDNPERDAWQRPAELIAALELQAGSTVADIGAGTGYFNPHLAAAVGPEGKVIAIDVEQTLVDHMNARALTEQTRQVEARLGAFADPGLKPGEADVVMLVDTYHHIDGRRDYFRRLATTLRPGGRLVIVDFRPGELPVGPPAGHKLPAEVVRSELAAAGYTHTASLDVLPHQYVEVFTVAPALP